MWDLVGTVQVRHVVGPCWNCLREICGGPLLELSWWAMFCGYMHLLELYRRDNSIDDLSTHNICFYGDWTRFIIKDLPYLRYSEFYKYNFSSEGSDLYLKCIKNLLGTGMHHLESEEVLVPLVNLLQVLLILNLQLVEINLMENFTHFFFLKSNTESRWTTLKTHIKQYLKWTIKRIASSQQSTSWKEPHGGLPPDTSFLQLSEDYGESSPFFSLINIIVKLFYEKWISGA